MNMHFPAFRQPTSEIGERCNLFTYGDPAKFYQ